MTARTSFRRTWDRLNSNFCQKIAIDFRKPCTSPVWFLRLRVSNTNDWLNTAIGIEHRSPSRLLFFSLMQIMSFVAVYIDFAFVTQEEELSDGCFCCMKRCHSFDQRWWSAVMRHKSSLSCFIPRSIFLWNTLPSSVQSAKTVSQCKSLLKLHMRIYDLVCFSVLSLLFSPFSFFFSGNSVRSMALISIRPCFSAILPK